MDSNGIGTPTVEIESLCAVEYGSMTIESRFGEGEEGARLCRTLGTLNTIHDDFNLGFSGFEMVPMVVSPETTGASFSPLMWIRGASIDDAPCSSLRSILLSQCEFVLRQFPANRHERIEDEAAIGLDVKPAVR